MLSVSEWSQIDNMLNVGINAYIQSQTVKPLPVKVTSILNSAGSIQALACILGELKPARDFGNGCSIFASMNSSAQNDFLCELLCGLESAKFEVATSSLQVLAPWTSSSQGAILDE